MDDAVKLGAKAIGSLPYPLNEYSIAKEVLDAVGFTTIQDREATLIREREWQPIETAPKDESLFLIWPYDSEHASASWWGGAFHLSCCGQRADFTHWMPLPSPYLAKDDSILVSEEIQHSKEVRESPRDDHELWLRLVTKILRWEDGDCDADVLARELIDEFRSGN